MSAQPFSVVAYGAWSFASAGSYVEVDGNCFQLKWQCAADGSYTAENWEAQVEHMKAYVSERPAYFLAQLEAAMAKYQ